MYNTCKMPFELIIAQCRKQQPQAQMAFYRMFCEQVFQRCNLMLKDAEHAEEIMQDTLLKMLLNIETFKGNEKEMQKLLNRIAINQTIDVLRKRKSRVFIELESLPEMIGDNPILKNDEHLIETTLQHLDTLPEGYRTIVLLRVFEEMPFDEIGKKLNITSSTARSQYVRAIQKLRDKAKNQ